VQQVLPYTNSAPTRILEAPALVRLWHLTSLDAPTVALVWSLAFAWVAHVRLPLWAPALLVLAVWAVYIADRLLDARAGLSAALRERHLFHWRHRRILLSLAVVSAATAAWIVVAFMPIAARERNSLLAAASLVYFTGVHAGRRQAPLLSKEMLVGLLFTAGCALPAWSRAGVAARGPLLVCAGFFALLAWLNCYAIDRWEALATTDSRQPILSLAALLAFAGLVLAAGFHAQPRVAALLVAGSAAALLLAMLDRVRGRLTSVALRAAADLALLTPLILLPVGPLLK
jgi:hypothetical protein